MTLIWKKLKAALVVILIFILIIDVKYTTLAAQSGIDRCIKTIIPSLFPLMVLTTLLTPYLSECSFPLLNRYCNIPKGCEGLLIIGLISGFPIGAHLLANSAIRNEDSEKMLGYVNNCGVGFLYGVIGCVFQSLKIPFLLWIIQAESALLVASLWEKSICNSGKFTISSISISTALKHSVRSIAVICGWVILFTIIVEWIKVRLNWMSSSPFYCIIPGFLEISSGISALQYIHNSALQFILLSSFISWGGLCVMMQIKSIASDKCWSIKPYIFQKITMCIISGFTAWIYIQFGYPTLLMIPVFIIIKKIAVENQKKV